MKSEIRRVDVGARVLEHDCDLGPVLEQRGAGQGQDVGAIEADRASHFRPVGQQAGDRLGGHGLPGAGLAD
jgi:hypothetical protein